MDNAKKVVARLPFALAGPGGLLTASELATIKYCNEAGSLNFPAYGSIYFTKTLPSIDHRHQLDKDFYIGPHCGTRYWDCNVGERRYYHNTKPNQGPWTTLSEYFEGLIAAGFSRIPPVGAESESEPTYHGSVQSHLRLLECCRVLLRQMSADSRILEASNPLLFHPDLHKRNIFVSDDDPSVASSIEPSFWYADEVPDFAQCLETGQEIYTQAYDVSSQFLTPKLARPRLLDENLFRPFRYCYLTWKNGAVALHHEMIEAAQHWKELGLTGPCPYPLPSSEELANHQREYKLFEAAQTLRSDLAGLLNTASDGWVPLESWEETKAAHEELFQGMLQAVLTNKDLEDEPVKDEATLWSIWPFDINA
ncbi:hypothetical protein ASPZODRAFT_151976 [Penicilliopsis zonata CBS 506.65]|uniref:Aminoglycoside phosphotransferase domain-containing protein n=1 Tax=Penicilliopsis zonata CBS 506.65 TaxID=1073090 RepID=A0A1L9SH15_9EURO|nr:hypothetical protein ASPZODRAFT_151976 [Penicilliopsis zonata CBS 506.65]OJJ46441.1 hypothetical protein ASPZODRAFT_151976 [Penicilliopsis zonata CBS 506.65]